MLAVIHLKQHVMKYSCVAATDSDILVCSVYAPMMVDSD